MSTTASRPCRRPSGSSSTAIPPPPQAITSVPSRASRSMIGASTMRTGCGEAIVRRQPRLPSCMIVQPSSSARWRATSSVRNEPMGLSGFANAGSLRSTRVCVTSVTTGIAMPRSRSALPSAFWNMKPIAPCVSPTAYCTGTVGTWPSAISERRRMNPTCGPLPCVRTTFQPAPIMPATACAMSRTRRRTDRTARVCMLVADERVRLPTCRPTGRVPRSSPSRASHGPASPDRRAPSPL